MKANDWGNITTSIKAQMSAYDRLPKQIRDFMKTANRDWACQPMLRRIGKRQWPEHKILRMLAEQDA